MYNWKGVMVEPMKDTFEKMVLLNRNDQGLFFENVAISETTGEKIIYKVGISNAKWATALTSFDVDIIKNHLRNGFIQECAKNEGIKMPENEFDIISSESIKTITFSDLLLKHRVTEFDILLIDTEGYDYNILKLIDFSIVKPAIIVYENKHLKRKIYKRSISLLKKYNYDVFSDGSDTIALKKH